MLEVLATWTSTGGSGGLTPVQVRAGVWHSALTVEASTIATTNSFQFQTGLSSAGPWYAEGSTSIGATANVSAATVIRVTGPWEWMRPYFPTTSTGTYTIRLIGVGA